MPDVVSMCQWQTCTCTVVRFTSFALGETRQRATVVLAYDVTITASVTIKTASPAK